MFVDKLRCKVCAEFVDKIRGKKNLSDKWISAADSVCTNNVCDHARNDQHVHAMLLLKKQRAESSGLGSRVLWLERERLKVKFDVAYCMARLFFENGHSKPDMVGHCGHANN